MSFQPRLPLLCAAVCALLAGMPGALGQGPTGSSRADLERRIGDNPWNAGNFADLANAAMASGDTAAAERAFLAQRRLGYETASAALGLAELAARSGDVDGAIAWIDTAAQEGLPHVEFTALRRPAIAALLSDARFAEHVFPVAPEASRAEQWRIDLDFLDRRVRQTHIAPFRRVSEAEWSHDLARLMARADTASDADMAAGLMALMARLGDGHSFAFTPNGDDIFGVVTTPAFMSSLPVHLYWFGDELRVIGAAQPYRDLIGSRVIEIGTLSTHAAATRMRAVTATDNEMGHLWIGPSLMATPELLVARGIAESARSIAFTLETERGERFRRDIRSQPSAGANFARLAVVAEYRGGEPDRAQSALHLRHALEPFAMEYLSRDDILFVQINTVGDSASEPFGAFAGRVSAEIGRLSPRAVVLDLRHNSGGDSTLNPALVTALAASPANAPGRLYVIIGRRTFSAAVNLTSDLMASTDAILVGEPTGSSPNFVGETNGILLPNTGMVLSASSRMHLGKLSDARDIWWAPDIAAPPDWESYRQGRDPALEAIIGDLEARGGPDMR